ncbi:MAG: endolytic transglycosylase MltG [Hyphomicrobium sp.]|nr:endolytic transglycosylase MltG [Hyphomicrobium sp.]
MNSTARVISSFLTFIVLIMVAIGAGAWLLNHLYERPGPLQHSATVVIQKGDGRIAIAEQLEKEGVIWSRWAMVLNHLVRNSLGSGKSLELKAGEYAFERGASMRQVIETIASGKSVLAKVTVPEGLTSQQIVERIKADETLTGEITAIPAEGTLLPDTYLVSPGTSRQDLVERMQAEQAKFIEGIWEKRQPDLPVKSVAEAITLASIVEKETGQADERERVAAVFVNRLRKNMRLQSDPTIIYGIVGGQGTLGRSITRADIDTKTDYNTYRINGLPPGPICNPGRAALIATLNPAATKDLYFVADGSGGHKFSETLAQHNAAVRDWRKIEKQSADDAAADAARDAETEKAGKDGGDTSATLTPVSTGAGTDAPSAAPTGDAAIVPAASTAEGAAVTAKAEPSNIPLPVRKPKL